MPDVFAVVVRGLTVRFGDFTAVDDISFSVKRGEIFGFLGANGAGKTTTIRVLCGLIIPDAGEVAVGGATFADGEGAIKANVGYMSQKFTLYNDLTVEENLSFIAGLRKLSDQVYKKRRKELLDFIAFNRSLSTLVMELPGGTKQQVSLAGALLHDPQIVFLDEPTAGVTPAARQTFWELIRKLASDGKTVFVTTHYMDEAEQCDRIALMRQGQIIGLNTPAELKRETFPEHLYEFEPRHNLNFADVLTLSSQKTFAYFEPYGLRFHATIGDKKMWDEQRPRLDAMFKIRQITPTLEDVFIKRVEGGRP